MLHDASHLRDRARECRAIAKGLRDETDASMLEDLAAELDAEADKKAKPHEGASE